MKREIRQFEAQPPEQEADPAAVAAADQGEDEYEYEDEDDDIKPAAVNLQDIKPAAVNLQDIKPAAVNLPTRIRFAPTADRPMSSNKSSAGSTLPTVDSSIPSQQVPSVARDPGHVQASVYSNLRTLERMGMDGTEWNPYVVPLNLNKPEANYGFEVVKVEGLEHSNFTRDVYIIRKTTTVGQEVLWDAEIPVHKFPALGNRSILLRGPSQDYWHTSADLYHQDERACKKTKLVHTKLETAISKTPDRKYSYWLLVFPEGTILENHVFSGDAVHVRRETNDMNAEVTVTDGHGDDAVKFQVELFGVSVYWRIAIAGGEMIRSPDRAVRGRRFRNRKTAPATNQGGEGEGEE